MPWQQLKINLKADQAEAVGDVLSDELEAQAVTFVDAKDTPMYEPKPGEVLLWPDTQVIALFDAQTDIQPKIDYLRTLPFFQSGFNYSVDQLEDRQWERAWMDDFHPMQFGKRLWICPSWTPAPEPDAVNIKLDPGLAFGTGTHPTTSLCLKWLDAQDLQSRTVIDFGCGSGILAVAALKLGAARATGIDIDPQALIASKQNALNNEVEDRLDLYLPEHQPAIKADIVIANILAAPLKELHAEITDLVKPGGMLIMSGILLTQVNEVLAKYEHSFVFEPVTCEGEWIRAAGKRKTP
uniref:50S ribosomal protein L11 methyltransferase n=1 Tax=Ningiella ruwaisensis TaxID=2364274 RepID=UPI0010A038AA|nr:50S ribosomal protein L11 methyltransferase [Ningiella ruwaisensis]